MQLECVRNQLADAPEKAREHLETARKLVRESMREARRTIWNLRPLALGEANLASALQKYARELTHDTEAFDADVLIATGQRTGDPTRVDEVSAIKSVATRPVIVGSGLTAANAASLMAIADGAIVGSSMKHDGVWWNPVDLDRVTEIMEEVQRIR